MSSVYSVELPVVNLQYHEYFLCKYDHGTRLRPCDRRIPGGSRLAMDILGLDYPGVCVSSHVG